MKFHEVFLDDDSLTQDKMIRDGQLFEQESQKLLIKIAFDLGLNFNDYDIHSKFDKSTGKGEIVLHSNRLYITINPNVSPYIMYHSCTSKNDYLGGPKNYVQFKQLLKSQDQYHHFKKTLIELMKSVDQENKPSASMRM